MKSMRGNVPTRLEKLAVEPYDAIVLAAAGLKRLDLQDRITRYFSFQEMVPAPGQGILAIQSRTKRPELQELLDAINDDGAARAARIERSFSKVIGGGCKSPTGAHAFREGDQCVLIGMREGSLSDIKMAEMRTPWDESEDLGEKLARKLLEM
jgi:hydroxymethylbilane synthase